MPDQVVETHCSTLFFVDDLVYKRKKPLDLGFADFRTLDDRRAACAAEVALNQRLSPDIYLGVATVLDPAGQPCEALVVMRRLPDASRLSSLVLAGADVQPALDQVAVALAGLHRRSPAPARLCGVASAEGLTDLWSRGLDELRAYPVVEPSQRERTRELALRYLRGRESLLARRLTDGRVVDGHGDLLADDTYVLADGPRLLDCLEFDERLRVGDGLLDAAFLAMDLERLGRPDLARAFMSSYRAAASDAAPTSLEHHYLAYRAHIRCKVACIRAQQTGGDAGSAKQLAAMALEHLEAGRVRLVLVGGLPGSGKTTLATALADTIGATVLSSDVVRKQLCGLPVSSSAAAPLDTGIYQQSRTTQTYDELQERARRELIGGVSVVVDASFTRAAHRQQLRQLASDVGADLTELQCVVDDDLANTRITTRKLNPSDATPEVRSALGARSEPWPEAHRLDTAGNASLVLEAGRALLLQDPPPAEQRPMDVVSG